MASAALISGSKESGAAATGSLNVLAKTLTWFVKYDCSNEVVIPALSVDNSLLGSANAVDAIIVRAVTTEIVTVQALFAILLIKSPLYLLHNCYKL